MQHVEQIFNGMEIKRDIYHLSVLRLNKAGASSEHFCTEVDNCHKKGKNRVKPRSLLLYPIGKACRFRQIISNQQLWHQDILLFPRYFVSLQKILVR